MANVVIKILDLILVPFKYYGFFVVCSSFLVLSYLCHLVNRLIRT